MKTGEHKLWKPPGYSVVPGVDGYWTVRLPDGSFHPMIFATEDGALGGMCMLHHNSKQIADACDKTDREIMADMRVEEMAAIAERLVGVQYKTWRVEHCTKCSKRFHSPGAKFCGSCGEKLGGAQ